MTAAHVMSNIRDAESALWWAIRDGVHADQSALDRMSPSLTLSLDNIDDFCRALRDMLVEPVDATEEA